MQDVYSAPEMRGSFDAVATCFFIDTAHNVLEYLEVGDTPAFSPLLSYCTGRYRLLRLLICQLSAPRSVSAGVPEG